MQIFLILDLSELNSRNSSFSFNMLLIIYLLNFRKTWDKLSELIFCKADFAFVRVWLRVHSWFGQQVHVSNLSAGIAWSCSDWLWSSFLPSLYSSVYQVSNYRRYLLPLLILLFSMKTMPIIQLLHAICATKPKEIFTQTLFLKHKIWNICCPNQVANMSFILQLFVAEPCCFEAP